MRIGLGTDRHRLVAGRRLVLGGIEIPFEQGLEGHSDADVVLHAIADAVLGAIGEGDIGELFPDDDERNRGIDSAVIVGEALRRAAAVGFLPHNLDVVIEAERPKLGDYKRQIRGHVAGLMGLPEQQVNIKAKTGEKVGPVGRGEAIQCLAVVLLKSQSNTNQG